MSMRLPLLLGLASLVSLPATAQTPAATADPGLAQRYQQTITPAELAGHLYVYADDYMAGRETGQPGQRFASLYLAGQYQAMGVAPKGSGGAAGPYGLGRYLQPFTLERERLTALAVTAARDGRPFVTSRATATEPGAFALVPVYGSVEDPSPAPVVAVADGSDLAGLDLAGAYALLTPAEGTDLGAVARQIGAAGARGVVVASAPTVDALAGRTAAAFGGGRLALPPTEGEGNEDGGLPPIFLTGLDIAGLIADAGTTGDTGATLAVEATVETETVATENVIAVVEGSDPALRDEYVVVSAHLDHVGDDGEGEDAIYNGADDDGSGTVTLLEIAEAFQTAKEAGHGPRRSVLFLHVTGEEEGLLGSAYFTDREPLVPIESVAANLNIDMIGRYDPERGFETTDYVYVIGGDLISQDIADWNAAVNDATGTGLLLSDRFNSPDDPNQFFRRSDHWNFGKYDVPFIFYFTGTHEDYHSVGDSADKIDYDRMARIARLVFGTAWEIANTDARPRVSGGGFN